MKLNKKISLYGISIVIFGLVLIGFPDRANAGGGLGGSFLSSLLVPFIPVEMLVGGQIDYFSCNVNLLWGCDSSGNSIIPTLPAVNVLGGPGGCNFQLPFAFFNPRLNESYYQPPMIWNPNINCYEDSWTHIVTCAGGYEDSAPILDPSFNETGRQVAIYRFTLPASSTQAQLNDWFVNQIPAAVGAGWEDMPNGTYSCNSWDICTGSAGVVSNENYRSVSDSTLLATVSYNSICSSSSCLFIDNGKYTGGAVPGNSYVAYVAKLLGNYSYVPLLSGVPSGSIITHANKFLNNNKGSNAYFPSTATSTVGNAIIGPFKTGVPVCDGACSTTHYGCTTGTSTLNVDGANAYTWSCPGTNGGTTASCSEPKNTYTLTLTANPNPVNYSSASTLSWTIQDAVGCWGYSETGKTWPGGDNYQAISGNVSTGNLIANQTYKMNCWNSAGVDVIGSVTVTILPSSTNTLTLTAEPNPVNYNSASTLSWTTQDAVGCWGYSETGKTWPGGDNYQAISDNVSTGNLIANQTYNMDCWDSAGTIVTKSVPVNVFCACGASNGVESCNPNALCNSGSASAVTESGGNFNWTCSGSTCSGSASCSSPKGNPDVDPVQPLCGSYGNCSLACGGGTQSRTCFYHDCSTPTETLVCNSQPCPPGYREVTPW